MRTVGVEIVGAIGRRPGRRTVDMTGVSTDSRAIRPGELFFALPGARVDGHDFVPDVLARGAAAAVVSRDVAVAPELRDRLVRVEDTLRALGDSAREYRRRWGGTVIGITGSNGKTTTREMTWHALSEQMPCKRSPKSFNTEVGVPLTLFLLEAEDRAAVVEMGTNAPGEIAELARIAEPNIGVITSISETHLEGLGSEEGVARAKAELLEALGPKGVAFLNADDKWFEFLRERHAGRTVAVGAGEKAEFRATEIKPCDGGYGYTVRGCAVRLTVPGRHNVTNSLLALAVAEHLGLDLAKAAARMASFRMPEMRYQVERVRGIEVHFDGYNANPGSMRSALETFRDMPVSGRRVAVLGDMLELGESSERLHDWLGTEAARSRLDGLWAVGQFAPVVARAALANGLKAARGEKELDAVAAEICASLHEGDAVLVKGSRGMKLERFVERLRNG